MRKNIETFIACDSDYKSAGTVLFGAPYDSTTSFRPGARFSPRAIRSESFGIETYSPYQNKDLMDIRVFDGGDLELPFGNSKRALDMITKYTRKVLRDGKLPCMAGGEHLVTLGAARAAAELYPDLSIIHLDAHSDLRDEYLGEKLSHACVMRRIWEVVGDGRIYQFGIRSGDKSEFVWAPGHVYTRMFDLSGIEDTAKKLKDKPVYLTVDLDVLDPSVFPGTGTPEAGGVSFNELSDALFKLSGLNIVGMDITELSPVYDQSGISTAAAVKVLRELLLLFSE
jgi:agmatinase